MLHVIATPPCCHLSCLQLLVRPAFHCGVATSLGDYTLSYQIPETGVAYLRRSGGRQPHSNPGAAARLLVTT